jgi:hypothetical protein
MDEVPNAPGGPATWYMPGAGVDSNSGSFITNETSGVKLRRRKVMTVKSVTVHCRKNGANGTLQ